MFVQASDTSEQKLPDECPLQLVDPTTKKTNEKTGQCIKPYKTANRGKPEPNPSLQTICDITTKAIRLTTVAHTLTRLLDNEEHKDPQMQAIGAFSGFKASLHKPMQKSNAIFAKSYNLPPNKTVVHQVMCDAVEAANTKAMPFIQLVGDQPVYALIVELKNENPQKFDNIVPMLGGFHTEVNFISAIYKRFDGSGLQEWLVESGVIESGSCDQALRGKHYKRGMRVYKLAYESMMRKLIMDKKDSFSPDLQYKISCLSEAPDGETLKNIETNTEFISFVESLSTQDSEMANYWTSFLEMVEILLMHNDSLRSQCWENYCNSLRLMQPWLAAYNNTNYTRYITIYWASLQQLNDEQLEHMRNGAFSSSLTGNPYSAIPHDQWIEMTMNKASKMKGG